MIASADSILRDLAPLLSRCAEFKLVTLFGSCARGSMTAQSDIDLLIWLHSGSQWNRKQAWQWLDVQPIPPDLLACLSPVIKRWSRHLSIDTLLLDFPEEHLFLVGDRHAFVALGKAVVDWRSHNGASKIPSFNGTHAWRYTNDPSKDLSDLDFTIEVPD